MSNRGLKAHHPDISFAENQVTVDEIDRYEQYVVGFPTISTTWFGTPVVAGTSAVAAIVIVNAIADYPRNLQFAIAGSHGAMTGTAHVLGKNQFGEVITEDLTFNAASNGGTVDGTKVFAQVTAGTVSFGTAVGGGTARIGVGIAGTATLFGLPSRIGAATDVKLLTRSTGAGAQTVNGGTIAAFVDTDQHAVKAPADLTGTQIISVLYKPTYVPNETAGTQANLDQRT